MKINHLRHAHGLVNQAKANDSSRVFKLRILVRLQDEMETGIQIK